MKVVSSRSNLPLDYTPRQWMGFMNTCLLVFVTLMFGLVLYNMRTLDQQLIRVLDSSVVAIDLLANDLVRTSQRQSSTPYWRTVGHHNLTVYSAFYKEDKVLIVGSNPRSMEPIDEDLRCLIQYEDDKDEGLVDYKRVSDCGQTALLFCPVKKGAVPKKVALGPDDDVQKQWMDVIRTKPNKTFESPKTAACVRPLRGDESVKDVAEFVAFYETIGVDHIYFYDHSASLEVVDFLLKLERAGHSISHLQWNKEDDENDPEDCPIVWSEYVQDCVRRGSGKYSDVVTVGVSEFVVPADYFRLPEMLEQVRLSHHASRLRLRSAKFCESNRIYLGSLDRLDLGKKTVRGELKPSGLNYIIRLDAEGELADQISDVTLPGSDVIVHRHSERCDRSELVNDFTAFKYSHIVEQSDVLKLYRTFN